MGYKFNPFTGNLDVVDTTAAAGATTQVQFNDAGAFGGDSGLTFNKTTDALSAGGFIPTSSTVPANGIYLPAANRVGVATNGTGRLFVDANGFVGIGAVNTGSAGAQLSTTTTSSTARLIVESTNAAGYTGLRVANGTGHWEMQVDGANQGLRWLDDGSERLRITSAGLVGIGTSAPTALLEVFATINSELRLNTSADGYLQIGQFANGASIGTSSADATTGALRFVTAGSEKARFDTSGRLGIGTSAPDVVLDVRTGAAGFGQFVHASGLGGVRIAGTGQFSASSLVFANNHSAGVVDGYTIQLDGANQSLKFLSGGTAATARMTLLSDGKVGIGVTGVGGRLHVVEGTTPNIAQLYVGQGGGSNNYYDANNHYFRDGNLNNVISTTSSTIQLFTGGSERARIDSSGRLGIGTSAPSNLLHIASAPSTSTNLVAAAFARSTGANAGIGDYIRLGQGSFYGSEYTSADWGSSIIGAGHITFYTGASSTPDSKTAKVRIDSSGRVGIGNTAPGQALDVVGSINLTGNHTFSTTTSPLIAATAASSVLRFGTGSGGTERARIDDSGRLLVGTSTASATATQILQGNSGAASGNGKLIFARGTTSPADGLGLGEIAFSDSSHSSSVTILAARDGGTWTSETSQPSRLVFSTTADGAASSTERLRITSAGVLQVADAGNITVGTTTGTKIGTATTQKLGFWDKTPVVQPTTGISGATFVADSGGSIHPTSTFDGYTIAQVVAALRQLGILA
jgi:hypothetical protein